MSVRRCCALRCNKPATVVREVGPSHIAGKAPVRGQDLTLSYVNTGTVMTEEMVRRYEVCRDHDADYFGNRSFLSTVEVERIRRDLVPVATG
jgi:hypothetical protein